MKEDLTLNAGNFYNYFKECYKLDYKEFVIDNILSQKYPFKWFVSKKEELFNDSLPIIPYTNNKTIELEKEIELYKLEKKLFYGCFFVLGRNNNPLIRDNRVCAPLILFPATIVTRNEDKFLEIDVNSFSINRSVLTKLEFKSEQLNKDSFLKELSDKILNDKNSFIGLKSLFDKYFSNIDSEELLLFPQVWSANKIRSYFTKNEYDEDEFKIVPAAGTVLINKSESSLRVINDLNEMAKKAEFNSSVNELLNETESKFEFKNSYYKSRLNTDQYKALQNAYKYSNSVIVGPPGTGKTYTIASIITDAVINNQSVLVVSKTKQAVEVLRTMLQDDYKLKNYLFHTTGNNYKVSLKAKIYQYLSGISTNQQNAYINQLEVSELSNKLEHFESLFENFVEQELKISNLEFSPKLSLLEKWRKFYLKSKLKNGPDLWNLFKSMNETLTLLDKEISTYSKRKIQANIRSNSQLFRKDISLFYDALDSSGFTEYKRILKNVNQKNILKVFPIWLANLSDINSVLPHQKDLFDLVIIDEATQCDIASALPAIYRAKRSIIVGDPNQLRHYSFVSKAQQSNLRRKYNLPNDKIFDYRNRSILDFYISKVQNQDQVCFLREHFRSTPSLIEFSNKQFYDGQLEILKSTPKHTSHTQIEMIETNGERNEKGVNEIEANEVIRKLQEIICKFKDQNIVPSIGIISPFNSQVNYINKLIKEKYELKLIKKFKLLCGTPYNFQGSEREVILISFCVCNKTHPSAFIHANKPEVLNVAITRAKSFQIIFKSVTDSAMKSDSLLYQYFKFIDNFSYANEEDIEMDKFQNEVVVELQKKKFTDIKCGYPIAGSLLDILVTHNSKNYFIDLIGYPGMFKEAFTLERYKTLGRMGIKSIPVHYSFWKKNKPEAMKKIKALIK